MPQFVRDVEAAGNVKFTKFHADTGERYEYRDLLGVVCVWDEHELENDRGLNFED